MRCRPSIALLICIASVSATEEPEKDPKDAGRDLRQMFLTTSADKAGIRPSEDYPRIWGVAMDWPIGDGHIATVVSLSDGSASAYTTGTFGVIGGIGRQTVRTAAKKLIREADRYFSDSSPTRDLSYPSRDHVRFFLATFDGLRLIETDLASLSDRRSNYSSLFDAGQDVMTQLRLVLEQEKK
jgi:hypothetical protein